MWRFMVLSFVLFPVYLIADDSLAVHIYPESVVVYHLQAYRHCAPMYEITVTVDSNEIYIIETDTTTLFATCMCYFDIATTLGALAPGDYMANVVNKEGDRILFSGTIPFTVPVPTEQPPGHMVYSSEVSECYEITDIRMDGTKAIPRTFMQNFPNPFNPVLTINIEIAETSQVLLDIFDLSGKWVKTLMKGKANAGTHRQSWDGSQMPSGVYFIRLQTESEIITQKVILLK